MISEVFGKRQAMENESEELTRLLDLELIQKRAAWKRAAAHHRTFRMIGVFSILIVLAAVFFVLFFLFSRANEERINSRPAPISDRAGR
jgi:uncharacterized membrane protein YukC